MPGWANHLTEKTRVLLHIIPLIELRQGDARVAPSLRHYDGLALALKVFDLIVDHMGLDREIDKALVLKTLSPMLSSMDAAEGLAPDIKAHEAMTDRVLAALRNDAEARRPFAHSYQDFEDDGRALRRTLEFRLVSDEFHPSGGTTLRLSNEAVNLYLRALELDIEDAQAAAEAVVQSQLARGKFDEAAESARVAHLQSVRYQEKLDRILRDTQRDVRRVDWKDAVPRLLDDARDHISTRLRTEETIIQAARDRLEMLPDEQTRSHVTLVYDLSCKCRLRHTELHQRLMQARNVFLEAHERQALAGHMVTRAPEIYADIFRPLMAASKAASGDILSHSAPLFIGAQASPGTSLKSLVLWMLKPKRPPTAPDILIEQASLAEIASEAPRFPEALMAEIRAILKGLPSPTTLSALLAELKTRNLSVESRQLLALMALEQFASDATEGGPVEVARSPGRFIESDEFAGDELKIAPRNEVLS